MEESVQAQELSDYVTVLTYNTHLFAGSREDKLTHRNTLDDEERTTGIIERIKTCGADIVALQEVWASSRQEKVRNMLKQIYPHSCVSGQKEDWKDFRINGYLNTCGLVLLSKYNFISRGFLEYDRRKFFLWGLIPTFLEPEGLARKGCLFATVELRPGGPKLRVGITQTHTGHGEEERNVEQLAHMTTTQGLFFDSPAIIMGDFNVHANIRNKALTDIFDKFHAEDAFRAVHPDMSERDYTIDRKNNALHQKFFGPSKDPRIDRDRIDYVFVRKSGAGLEVKPAGAEVLRDWMYPATWRNGDQADLSDHYPLKVRFEVTRTPPTQ